MDKRLITKILNLLSISLLITLFVFMTPGNVFTRQNLTNQTIINNTSYTNYDVPLSELIKTLKLNPGKFKIHIEKRNYKLSIMYDSKVVKSYPVVFGVNPVDDKLCKGDGRTPEGTFKIVSKYDHSSWAKFIWIDYPNRDSWKKHRLAVKDGAIPVSSGIGGDIGIHGVPAGYDYVIDIRQNWTLGCISMKNKDVIEIFPYVTKITIIEITK